MNFSKWIIKDSLLCLKLKNNSIFVPTAQDIYNCIFKNILLINDIKVKNPANKFENIKFSKIPLKLKITIEIKIKQKDERSGIYVNVFAVNDYKDILINFNLEEECYDHIIINKTWHPFIKGAVEDIQLLFNKIGIKKNGKITLNQYIKLREKKEEYSFVEDKVLENFNELKSNINNNINEKIPLFEGELYSYQKKGYNWLKMISNEDAGCILADEMGLGKTVQIIALLANEVFERDTTSLIIVPATLIENWRREFNKFTPSIKILIHRGRDRTGFYTKLEKCDVIITSYDTMLRDLIMFKMIDWNFVILDEAQAIKNPDAKRTKAVKKIPRRVSLAMTGTPVENHITDLWSIMDFVFPGLLGNLNEFEKKYNDNPSSASMLEPIITPFLLRREVKDVAGDLPEKIEIPQVIELSDQEAIKYENLRNNIISQYEHNSTLVLLTKLRMFCTHPTLINESESNSINPKITNKYIRLLEILEEIISYNEKALIFTSFTEMSDIIVTDIPNRYEKYVDFIDGRVDVEERQGKIDYFSNISGSAFLVLNPRAAGTGLNITAANHVIHYNLEWNPAIEDQASARVYRKGQNKPVTIHRLYYANTVEDIVNERIENKRDLANAAIVGTDGKNNYNDILRALKISPLTDI